MAGIKKKNLPIVSGKINYLMWIVSTMGINKIPDWFSLSRQFSVFPLLPKRTRYISFLSFLFLSFFLTQYLYLQFK